MFFFFLIFLSHLKDTAQEDIRLKRATSQVLLMLHSLVMVRRKVAMAGHLIQLVMVPELHRHQAPHYLLEDIMLLNRHHRRRLMVPLGHLLLVDMATALHHIR